MPNYRNYSRKQDRGPLRRMAQWSAAIAVTGGVLILSGCGNVQSTAASPTNGTNANNSVASGDGRTSNNAGNATNVSTGTGSGATSSPVELAVFANTQSYSIIGYPLYTVLHSASGKTTSQEVNAHGIWAQFSPDGKWLAVAASPSPSSTLAGSTLWLMKSDGSGKVELLKGHFGFAAWEPQGDTLVYASSGGTSLHAVQPGQSPTTFPVTLAQGSTLSGIRFSPNGQYAAIWMTSGTMASMNAKDEVVIRTLATGSQKTLLQTKAPDGLFLGPWAADSGSLFWWPDPQHSASISEDGLTLQQTSLDGKTQPVTTTLIDGQLQSPQFVLHTVVPYGSGSAVLQTGLGRQVSMNKHIAIWQGGRLQTLPTQQGKVQLSPMVNANGQQVVFTVGPTAATSLDTTAQLQSWLKQFTLAVYQVNTGKVQQVTAAGNGVQTPVITQDGKDIVYIQGQRIEEISDSSQATPATIASVPQGLLQLVDYH